MEDYHEDTAEKGHNRRALPRRKLVELLMQPALVKRGNSDGGGYDEESVHMKALVLVRNVY